MISAARALPLATALAASLSAELSAQEEATRPPRERIALVAFVPNRIGLLIPLGERWMLRPDFTSAKGNRLYWDEEWGVVAGLTLIRRSEPTEEGWTYGALRYGIYVEQLGSQGPVWRTHYVGVTGGGHAQVREWLGLFGEAGVSASFFSQGGGSNPIDEFEVLTRVGIAMRRARRAPERE